MSPVFKPRRICMEYIGLEGLEDKIFLIFDDGSLSAEELRAKGIVSSGSLPDLDLELCGRAYQDSRKKITFRYAMHTSSQTLVWSKKSPDFFLFRFASASRLVRSFSWYKSRTKKRTYRPV